MTIDITWTKKKLDETDTYYGLICKCGATITAKDKTYKCPACGNDAVLVGKMIRQYKDDE